ncbi:hypothetical protein Tsubulata_017270 [Turnera subulata]|uniref:Uncharacterized protein n=1 Tax=Turnera subulata TaxID=218843 RepID=A0A9Q0GEN7_9ROSI|nr:hypothetical protein Tsubulata_017270 [Turnera subulata]
MKLSYASLLLLSLLLSSFLLELANAQATAKAPAPYSAKDQLQAFCNYKCGVRCSRAGWKKQCLRLCDICCRDCKCVPSGPRAPKSECPCYEKKKNPKTNKDKCP